MSKITRNAGRRKVIPDTVIKAIREARGTQADIAIQFGVTQGTVSKIKTEKRRKQACV